MKLYKIQIRGQKNSQSCVPLSYDVLFKKENNKWWCADLRLLILRAEAGSARLHHVGELNDGGDRVLGRHRQLLLGGGRTRHQRLRVLNQRLRRLQDILSVT